MHFIVSHSYHTQCFHSKISWISYTFSCIHIYQNEIACHVLHDVWFHTLNYLLYWFIKCEVHIWWINALHKIIHGCNHIKFVWVVDYSYKLFLLNLFDALSTLALLLPYLVSWIIVFIGKIIFHKIITIVFDSCY